MSHRLQHLNRRNVQVKYPQQQQEQTPVQQNISHIQSHSIGDTQQKGRKIPRPIHPPTSQVYQHDKASFRKGAKAFPPVDSLYSSDNTYDAGPDFCRPTSAVMESGSRKFQFPLGVWISPLGSQQVHCVKTQSPLRCQRCKAYVNPYFRHDGTNKSTVCNICGVRFQIPQNIDKANLYTPQIGTEGVIDFVVADKFYMRKRLDIIKIIFALQMTLQMIETGIFGSIIQSIKSAIESGQFQSSIRFGIVYYNDDGVTFLKLNKTNNNETQTQQQVKAIQYNVTIKGQTYCCPLSDKQLLYNPNDQISKQQFLKLLDVVNNKAQKYFQKGKYINLANYVGTIKCLQQSFQNQTGRIMLFSQLDPRTPPCALRGRNQEEQKNPLKPISMQYYQLAKQLLANRIGIDYYVFSKEQVVPHQLATTHYICSLTGGSIYLYSPYVAENHSEHLYYSIFKNATKQTVYDVDLTCRISNGLTIGEFLVGDGPKQVRDIGFSMIDPSFSMGVTFQHEQKIEDNNGVFLQFAMMYTTGNGQRRIRTINYRYQLSDKLQAIHQGCDYLAFANILSRQYVNKLKIGDPIKVRQEFFNKLTSILAQYKQEGNPQTKYNQLCIHPNLAPALAYLHSIFNSKLFLNSIKISSDYRLSQILKINTYGYMQFALRLYPLLYPITSDIYQNQPLPGDFFQSDQEIAVLPQNLPLNRTSLSQEGVYLYNTGDYLIIIVMQSASGQLLNQLFGTEDWNEIQTNGLPQLESSHNIRVNNIIGELRRRNAARNGVYQPLLVRTPLKKGPFSDLVTSIMKQEYPQLNYFGFLDYIHRLVQTKGK